MDQVGVEERVAKFATRSIKKAAKVWGLKTAVSMTDLTTLEGKDTPGKIESLCRKALRPHDDPDVPTVAAVCVYPAMVRHAKAHVGGSGVKVASVATAFPSGQTPLQDAAGRGPGRGGGRRRRGRHGHQPGRVPLPGSTRGCRTRSPGSSRPAAPRPSR